MREEIKKRIEMIRIGEAPIGYKKTKIGIMPEEWEMSKLKKIFKRVNRKNSEGNTNVLTISAQDGLINQEDFFNKSIASEDKTDYYLLKEGEFAYNKSYSKGYPYGAIKRLILYKEGIVSPLYICFGKKSEDDNMNFYTFYFENGLMNREIQAFAQEGARNHGLLNISVNDFFDSYLCIPSPVEQNNIANILDIFEKKVELNKILISEKKKTKKYLMSNLLTGKTRLCGYQDEWKDFQLEDLFVERCEINSIDSELLSITGSGIIPRSEIEGKNNSSEDKSKYRKIYVGDIGYNTMRMWQGVSAYSNYEGIVSPAYTILKPKDNADAKFFSHLFKLPLIIFLFYRYSQGLVDDTRNLKYDNFKKIKVNIPTDIEEQKAIAQIFTLIDKEIELLERQLAQIKLEKRAMMQLLLTGIVRTK